MPRSNRRHRPLTGQDRTIMVLKQAGRMSNVAIAERLGVTEGAIRYRLKRMRAKAVDKRTQRPSRVSEYEGVIGSWVEDYAGRSHRPAIKALYERLVEHHGFPLSYDALRRYVKKRHPGFFGRKVRTRIETPPGLLALVDWKEKVAVRLGTPERWETLHCFVYVLGFSRKTVAVWSGSKDLASWIRAHAEISSSRLSQGCRGSLERPEVDDHPRV